MTEPLRMSFEVDCPAEHAFAGDSLEQQVSNHLSCPPPRPSLTRPGLPQAFDAVVAKGMAKIPSERYDSPMVDEREAITQSLRLVHEVSH